MIVLIIGLGSISRKHIKALNTIFDRPTVYALRSPNSINLLDGIINIYNIEDLANQPDFAIISNPTNLHFSTIELLVKHGIPMFIEKPALHTLNRSEYLLNLVTVSKLFNYVACNLRFHPCIEYLKEHLLDKEFRVNEVNVYCGSFLPHWRPNVDFKKIYSANKNSGGGVHLDLIHEIDYTYWLFGQPIKTVSYLSNKSSLSIDAIDYANYLLQYNNFNVSVILNYYRRDSKRTIEIIFDDTTWIADLLENKITNHTGHLVFECKNFTLQDTYLKQMNYFLDKLSSNNIPMNTLEESLEVLKMTLINE